MSEPTLIVVDSETPKPKKNYKKIAFLATASIIGVVVGGVVVKQISKKAPKVADEIADTISSTN